MSAVVPSGERVLDERTILARTKQYDAEVVFAAPLPSMKLTSLGSALSRFTALTVLDVSRNALRSLHGLGVDGSCSQLAYLNAAENSLEDITAVGLCPRLERVWLEGNQLKLKSSLTALTNLHQLVELRLRRTVMVDGAPLTLDNPVCGADAKVYDAMMSELFPSVRWVDDRVFRDDARAAETGRVEEVEADQKALRDAAAELERLSRAATERTSEEAAFQTLLPA